MGEHCVHEHHKITKNSVKVLTREDIWLKRKVSEAIQIRTTGHEPREPQPGVRAPPIPIYDELLLSCDRRHGSHRDLRGLGSRPEETCEVHVKA